MRYRNGAHGHVLVTKALHWLTVAAMLGQFLVGYSMDFGNAYDGQEDAVEAESDEREDAVYARRDDAAASVLSDVVTGKAFGDWLTLHVAAQIAFLAGIAGTSAWCSGTPSCGPTGTSSGWSDELSR